MTVYSSTRKAGNLEFFAFSKANNAPKPPIEDGRRQSDGRPIYRDPCEGQPDLPMPGSVRMSCADQYLYMKQDPTTPIYANPDPTIYMNQVAFLLSWIFLLIDFMI